MPINTDLNIAPYFDDFDTEKQFYRILYKPGYAVQARELTQLQSMLQNQVETFGDNIFQEGSIVKGCTFTTINGLQYVKLVDQSTNQANFTPSQYVSTTVIENIGGQDTEVDIVYEVETQNLAAGDTTKLKAKIIQAERGYTSKPPNLNTFFVNYLNETETGKKAFTAGEPLNIIKKRYIGDTLDSTEYVQVDGSNLVIAVAGSSATGPAFGIQAAPGIIFQKGNFIFTAEQTVIVEKYSNSPDEKSVGYDVTETIITALQDSSLYDNANGSTNENAPGADRLKLTPQLVVKETSVADADADFFTLIRYKDGNPIELRDVSQYNVLGAEMARRTYEESGNYIVEKFNARSELRDANTGLEVVVSPGVAYVKGYRIESPGEQRFEIDNVSNTQVEQAQPVAINYGSFVDVDEIRGTAEIDYSEADLEEEGTVIGKTFIRNLTQDRVYLFGSRITASGKSFADVTQIDSDAGRILISNNAVIQEQVKSPMVFPTGVFSVKNVSDVVIPVRERVSATISSGTITLTNQGGVYNYDINNDDVVVIDAGNTNRTVTSAVSQSNNEQLVISVSGGDSACTVYVNRNLQQTAQNLPYGKTAVKPYIKVAYVSTTEKYSLGFPDVYKIISVEDSGGTDYTNSFRLHTNQKDSYYDISYMEYIPGRPQPANGTLTIRLGVFQLNASSGKYYFAINSYPVDDDSTELPSDKIRSQDIHVYTASNGRNYNLRESIDFRPHVDKVSAADYSATSPGAAPTISDTADGTTPVFSRSDYLIPALNESMTMDIESYNARMDLITIDSYGEMSLVKGDEEQVPGPPKVSTDKMVVSEIFIPGYPALSAYEADRAKKPAYAIRTKSTGTKRYTMSDIAKVDKKLDRIEYYLTLSQLEQSAENINILDENGLSRFKNGYLAEPFDSLNYANMEDPLYDAAVPADRQILTPPIVSFPLDLKYKSSSSATIFPDTNTADVGTLSRNSHVQLIKQPYATAFRNCVSNFYDYRGSAQLSPSHDFGVDTNVNPVPVNLDISQPFMDFVDAIQQFIPLTRTRFTNLGRQFRQGDWIFQNQQVTTTSLDVNEGAINPVGDFVSGLEFNAFIRPQPVKIFVSGLRPNTRHYFFFDGIAIDDHVTPGTDADEARSVDTFGQKGEAVLTDDNGVLRAVFDIPAEEFYVGERALEVADVDTYSTIKTAGTSGCKISYHAYNVSLEQQQLQTRVPEFGTTTSTTTRNVAVRQVPRDPPTDPLAQTFFIKRGMGKGSNTVMISKVDLFFKRKSAVNGVTVELREVINGYPSSKVIPFSKTRLKPSQVSVSDNASAITTVDFEAPIRLETETEYAIVIQPDANDPDYLVFTSKVGGTDLTPGDTNGQAVVQDWGDGVLFTSTNNRAWKSYQDEDLKFTLYRHEYNASSGSVTMTNADHEFFTLSDWDGYFNWGELVYEEKTRSGSTGATISMAEGTNVITGTALDDTYAVGDFIKVENSGATREDLFEIATIESAGEITTTKKTSFGVSSGTGTPVVAGRVVYQDSRRPESLYLKDSSASATKKFTTSATITGFSSGTTGTISTIDDINLSYVQPMIQKSNDSASRTTLSGTFVDTANVNNYYDLNMKFTDANYFTKNGVIVYSKSNNIAGTKPFDITVSMTNGSNTTSSPFVDIETSMLMANRYRVDNTSGAKYISKVVELAAELDAEDMKVYLTGYRPNGTDIKVYIRPQHAYDSQAFDSIDWIELELVDGIRAFSSSSNADDYKEFVYQLADADKNADGALKYTSASGGDFVGFRKFAIRIDLLSPDVHKVPTVNDFRAIAIT